MGKNNDSTASVSTERPRFEDHILNTFHEKRALFEKGRIRFHAVANATCDARGVSVRRDVEVDNESLTGSGARDDIVVGGTGHREVA